MNEKGTQAIPTTAAEAMVAMVAMVAKLLNQAELAVVLEKELKAHTGTANFFRHSVSRGFCYTDGVRHFLRRAGNGAYWLIDILALQPEIYQGMFKHGRLQAVLLVLCGQATLTVAKDRIGPEDYAQIIYQREFPHTDCPPGEWIFHLRLGRVDDRGVVVACLPTED